MRVLWALILILLVAGGAMLLRGGSTQENPQPKPPAPFEAPIPEINPASLPTKPVEKPPVPADFEKDLANAIAAAATGESPDSHKAGTGTPVELPFHEEHPKDKTIHAKAERLANGNLLLDGRFEISGKGTQSEPYLVPFDLLVSASSTYDPRKGLNRLPQRVTFLHDTYVKLVGYVAFPISSTDPKEALVMLNQWDGCCIGVPPTAYDAVEVKLAKPASGDDRFITHGEVVGKLKVLPYTDAGWLLGLYLMEHGELAGDTTDTSAKKKHDSP